MQHHDDLITLVRLISIASRPAGGHYAGMMRKRPITLEGRLIADQADIIRAMRRDPSNLGEDTLEQACGPMLDYLHMCENITAASARARFDEGVKLTECLHRACVDAEARLRAASREARESEMRALRGLWDALDIDPEGEGA